MLLLKLLIVPFFLAAISLAARRWGPQVGGLLAGMPVMAGPILFFLAREQGSQFAANAAQGALLAVIASVAFGLVYAHSSQKFAWAGAIALAWTAWFGTALALSYFPDLPLTAAAVAVGTVSVGLFALPASAGLDQQSAPLPKTELVLRMFAGAVLVLSVTAVAATLGTRWAGLMAMFPVLGTILGIFCLRGSGPRFVAKLFGGMFRGFFAFISFCLTLVLLLPKHATTAAFASAAVMALLVQAGVYWLTVRHDALKSERLTETSR